MTELLVRNPTNSVTFCQNRSICAQVAWPSRNVEIELSCLDGRTAVCWCYLYAVKICLGLDKRICLRRLIDWVSLILQTALFCFKNSTRLSQYSISVPPIGPTTYRPSLVMCQTNTILLYCTSSLFIWFVCSIWGKTKAHFMKTIL